MDWCRRHPAVQQFEVMVPRAFLPYLGEGVALEMVLPLRPLWVPSGLLSRPPWVGGAFALEEPGKRVYPQGCRGAVGPDHCPEECRADRPNGALGILVLADPPVDGEADPNVGVHQGRGSIHHGRGQSSRGVYGQSGVDGVGICVGGANSW